MRSDSSRISSRPRFITRRRLLAAAGIAFAGAAGVGVYTRYVEPFWLDIVRRPLPIAGLPAALVGKRLVQISDMHVGRTDPAYLERALARLSDLAPDLLVFTGDFTSIRSPRQSARRVAATLANLPQAPLGTFACLGNHDYGAGWSDERCADEVTAALIDCGVDVLRNAARDASGLRLVGIDDLWSPRFDAAASSRLIAESTGASIVLCHNPDACDLPIWGNFKGWILSGHTHGGQCKPPFLPPPLLPVRNHRYTAGEFVIAPDRNLYINRALGYIRQMRINVRPEITVFELARA